jgi:hypothetical protein
MEAKKYRVNASIRAFSIFFTIISCGVIVLIIVGTISSLFEPICSYDFDMFLSCLMIIPANIILVTIIVSFMLIMLTNFSSITVSEQGFKVHSIIKETPWLNWQAIKKARKNPFIYPVFWHIGVEGLGALYKINGWIFLLGIGCFQIGENSIENYNELIGIFRQKRPDLFKKQGNSK